MQVKVLGLAYIEEIDIYLDIGQVCEFLIQEVSQNASDEKNIFCQSSMINWIAFERTGL